MLGCFICYNKHMQEDSVFTKIIKGELPSHKIYEDEQVIAFTPLFMAGKGHILVIPKLQVPYFYDLPIEEYQALMAVTQKLSKTMKAVVGSKYVGLKVVGVEVPHTHIHIIAFDNSDEYNNIPDDSGEPDHEKLESFAESLRAALY